MFRIHLESKENEEIFGPYHSWDQARDRLEALVIEEMYNGSQPPDVLLMEAGMEGWSDTNRFYRIVRMYQ